MMNENAAVHRLVAKSNHRKDKASSRLKQYIGVAAALAALFFILRRIPWMGDAHSHTLMEAIPTVLAFVVGVLALIRFYGHKDNLFLFIGTGFVGTGLFDLYHTFITHPYFSDKVLNLPSHLIPWSWLVSRIYLAVSMAAALVFWRREKKLGHRGRVREEYVYLTGALIMLGSDLFFLFTPLPAAYGTWHVGAWIVGRPQEWLAGALFAAALWLALRDGSWKSNDFMHWFVIGLIVQVFSQMLFMASSVRLHDAMFDAAHLLKEVGYLTVFVGLCYSIHGLFEDHKKLLADLNQSFAWLDNILETVPVGVAVLNIEGLILKTNRMWKQIYGYDSYDLIGRSFLDLTPPDERSWAWESFLNYLKNPYIGEVTADRELRGLCRDGTLIDVEISMGYIESDTEPLVIVCSRNISDLKRMMFNLKDKSERLMQQREMLLELSRKMQATRKMLEKTNRELKRSNDELKKFAYIASHDLQEPLRTMAGFSNLLLLRYADALDEAGRRYLRFIHDGAARLQGLIKDLLTYARLGSDELYQEEVDLGEVVQDAVDHLTELIRATDGRVRFNGLPVLRGNRQLMTELMMNLISNALKFRHPQRPPVVHIQAVQEAEHWVVNVADNGRGMPENFRQEAFGLFRRMSSHDDIKGSGIGLAICEKIVQSHGGRIWIESGEGEGTTVFFSWPVHPSPESIKGENHDDDNVSGASG